MIEIRKYCEYLYDALSIPIYLYDGGEPVAVYPRQDKNTYPPSVYLDALWNTDKPVTYIRTRFYSYYGCVKAENGKYCIIIGPVSDMAYSGESQLIMQREFTASPSEVIKLNSFFHSIPLLNPEAFISTLLLVNYTVNQTEFTRNDLLYPIVHEPDVSINRKYSEKAYEAKEEGVLHTDYMTENKMMHYIETGNTGKLREFFGRAKNAEFSKTLRNSLSRLKSMFIVSVTLASRAAIRGGLAPSIAYQLSDVYIQQVGQLTDADAIMSLLAQVQLDFTDRVANSITPSKTDKVLYQVLQYVRSNTNRNITVADIARQAGFSRSALSRKVKRELGFDLSEFIRWCKLEEAKELLAFSEKSISEISNYLCFSSQSHFQKSFKDKYGITPNAYRKSV